MTEKKKVWNCNVNENKWDDKSSIIKTKIEELKEKNFFFDSFQTLKKRIKTYNKTLFKGHYDRHLKEIVKEIDFVDFENDDNFEINKNIRKINKIIESLNNKIIEYKGIIEPLIFKNTGDEINDKTKTSIYKFIFEIEDIINKIDYNGLYNITCEKEGQNGGSNVTDKYMKYLNKKTVIQLKNLAKNKNIKITIKKEGKIVYLKKSAIIKKLCDFKHPKKAPKK